jgi:hypothetical protein
MVSPLTTRRTEAPATWLDQAYRALVRGEPRRAGRLLDSIDPGEMPADLRGVASLAEAHAALERGDLGRAGDRLEHAVAEAAGDEGRPLLEATIAVRAVVRALAGDEAGARADVAVVRATPEPSTLASLRAALAEAILLGRAGDRAGLAAALSAKDTPWARLPFTRERALVEALRKLAETREGSIYRVRAAALEPTSRAAAVLAQDVCRMAPEVEPFLETDMLAACLAEGRGRRMAMAPGKLVRLPPDAEEEERSTQVREALKGFGFTVLLVLPYLLLNPLSRAFPSLSGAFAVLNTFWPFVAAWLVILASRAIVRAVRKTPEEEDALRIMQDDARVRALFLWSLGPLPTSSRTRPKKPAAEAPLRMIPSHVRIAADAARAPEDAELAAEAEAEAEADADGASIARR